MDYHQQSFASGILDPLMQGAASGKEYGTSLRDIQNYYPIPQGPLVKRPGSKFVFPAESNQSKLFTITYSNDKVYCLEFTNYSIRFYTDGGIVLNGLNPFQVPTPYSASQVKDVNIAQNGDEVYIVHPLYAPRKLTPNGLGFWGISVADINPLPMNAENVSTLSMSYDSANARVDSSTIYFSATDVGRQLRLKDTTRWVVFKITGFVNNTRVTGVLLEDPTYVNPNTTYTPVGNFSTTKWAISAWGLTDNTIGYPSIVGFSQQRLIYGGYARKPNRIDASHIGLYDCFSFSTPITDSVTALSAFSIELASGQRNKIKWIDTDEDGVLIGTEACEFTINATNNLSIGIENAYARSWSQVGSKLSRVAKADEILYFVSKTGRSLHAIVTNGALSGKYTTADLSYKVKTLFDTGVSDICFVRSKYPLVWLLLNDGSLLSCSIDKATGTIAYARHNVGGVVKSITSVLDAQGAYEELWMVVDRSGFSTIERLGGHYVSNADVTEYPYVDCAFQYNGPPTNTLTAANLNLLNGRTVQVVADGAFIQEAIVTAGQIILNSAVTKAFIGLAYSAKCEFQTPEIATRTYSTTVGLSQLISSVSVQVYDTVGVNTFSPVVYEDTFRTPEDTFVRPYTGWKRLTYIGHVQTVPEIVIGSAIPFPSTILSVRMSIDIKGYSDGAIGG